MLDLDAYTRQSRFSDPGKFTPLIAALPTDVGEMTAVIRNVITHYRAGGVEFTGDHLDEINGRWVDRILAADQARRAQPLAVPRAPADRVAGCCRDFTLLAVAALRHRGIPARSRIGFASYFLPDFHCDHVIVDYWDGDRWVFLDAELDPTREWPFNPADMPRLVGAAPVGAPVFATAAQVWTAYRRGDIDDMRYGVDPSLPFRGAAFIRDYVIGELAHLQRDEMLLWDGWGAMSLDLGDDLTLIDEVAALLLAADDGDASASVELAKRYAEDARLGVRDRIVSHTPNGRVFWTDVENRQTGEL
jgi:hypothetical protein